MVLVRTALVIALGVLLWPATASADVRTQRDAVGDVVRSPVEGDIVATRVAHARRAVYVQVRFRELSPSGNGTSRWCR